MIVWRAKFGIFKDEKNIVKQIFFKYKYELIRIYFIEIFYSYFYMIELARLFHSKAKNAVDYGQISTQILIL